MFHHPRPGFPSLTLDPPPRHKICKISTLELLLNHRLDLLADVGALELQSCIKHLFQSSSLDRKNNNMAWMVSGKRCSGVEDGFGNVESRGLFVKAIKEFMYLSGGFCDVRFHTVRKMIVFARVLQVYEEKL